MSSNQFQADYWSTESGFKWISFEKELDVVFGSVDTEIIRRAAPEPGEKVMDVGCGTGATTRAISTSIAPSGRISALDISDPLLSHAKEQASETRVNTSYHLVDVQNDPIPGGPFDLAISRFGVMFFSDPVAAFVNIRKHLKPDGRIVLAAWAKAKGNPWFEIPRDAAIDRLGPIDTSDPHAPGPLGFQDVGRVVGILEKAGLQKVSGTTSRVFLTHPGPLDDVAALASNIGPAARVLKRYGGNQDDIDAIKDQVFNEFRTFETSNGIRIPANLNFFTAQNGG